MRVKLRLARATCPSGRQRHDMPRLRPRGILERTAAGDLWKHTLSRIPTVFGRVAYLASLRDANSGVYRHHGLAAMFGRDESSRALRESHEEIFSEWVCLPLVEKNADLMGYLDDLGVAREIVVENWLQSKIYRTYIPAATPTMERELFLSDLEQLLESISNAAASR